MADVVQTSESLAEFFAALDQHTDRIPLDELRQRLETLSISMDDVREVARFGEETYRRNLLRSGAAYQALVLCWRNGQRSPIHDHRGSSCGVRVIAGTATETNFERSANGLIYATGSREMPQGAVCGSQDDDKHQISNLQAGGADLVTLHIYSPPLLTMGTYSLTDDSVAEFTDPIHECCDGGGI